MAPSPEDFTKAPIRTAATTMLVRQGPSPEILMLKRNAGIDLFSGAMLFPGGKVEPQDLDPRWADTVDGWAAVDASERGPRIAALREAFEECGVIVAAGNQEIDSGALAEERAAVDHGQLTFLDFVSAHSLRLDLSRLTLFSRWLTPPVVSRRFDTYFYLIAMPANQEVAHDGREAIEHEWVAPSEALRRARSGERTIFFPTRMNLQLLAEARDVGEAVARAVARPARQVLPGITVRDGTRMIVLSDDDGYGEVEEPLEV